jgi:hypothetical protein
MEYGLERALAELQSIIDSQWQNGMLPHIRFVAGQGGYSPGPEVWQVPSGRYRQQSFETSGITQPPIIGMMMGAICRRHRDTRLLQRMGGMLEAVVDYYRFLFRERDPNGEGLVSIVHPWESGLDNSPVFDAANERAKAALLEAGYRNRIVRRQDTNNVEASERPGKKDYELYGLLIDYFLEQDYDQASIAAHSPFCVQDVIYNTLLGKSLHELAWLAGELAQLEGDDKAPFSALQAELSALADDTLAALQRHCYDARSARFQCRDSRSGEAITAASIHGIFPLLLPLPPQQSAPLLQALADSGEYATPCALPSTPASSPLYNPINYWRGPVWPITNWFLIQGLRHHAPRQALQLAQHTMAMIAEGYPLERTYELAVALQEFNSVAGRFTTPSKNQYKHGWLWDSCFAALGWQHVTEKADSAPFEALFAYKQRRKAEGASPAALREELKRRFDMPLFYEYYASAPQGDYPAGQPLGSDLMTWTASVFIDLYHYLKES